MTTGTYALYARTGAAVFAIAGVSLLALLAMMWTLVAGHTVLRIVWSLQQEEAIPTLAAPSSGATAA
jgi:hypothetical protein